MKKKFLLSLVASGILLSGMSFGLVTKHIDNAYAVDSKEEAKYDKFLGYVTLEHHQYHFISGPTILSFVDRNGKKIDIPDYKFINVRATHEADPTGLRWRTNPIRNSLSENVWTFTHTNAYTHETSTYVQPVQVLVFFWDGKDNTKVMVDKYLVKNTNGVLSYELDSRGTGIGNIDNLRGATGDPIYLGLKEKMKVTPTAPIKPSEKENAGANNNAGTEVKPNNDGNANAGTNSSSAVAPAPTPVKPETKVYTEAEIEALQNKAADFKKEVAELEKLIAENENNPDAVDYVTAAKNKLEDKKAELEKKEAELEEALKGLEPKAESSNGTEAPINNVPELGNVDKLKIEAEIEQLKEQIKDGEENGAEPYYIEGLKARLADLEEALAILAANKPAVNEVPEFDLSKLPQPGVPTPAPGAAGPDFGQNPQGDGNNFGPKTEAKEVTLPNTGMTTSSTVALGLSLIALVGLAVRRKLNN